MSSFSTASEHAEYFEFKKLADMIDADQRTVEGPYRPARDLYTGSL